jgi:hypothetical protein
MPTFPTLFWPYDLYERHSVVAHFVRNFDKPSTAPPLSSLPWSILDVGGRAELLSRFLTTPIITANPDGTGHLAASATALPFRDDTFTAVVSIDTLEHLSTAARPQAVAEFWRVAQRGLVVAAPFGSPAHRAHEIELDQLYRTIYGRPHPYLAEHVQYGLPDLDEIMGWRSTLAPPPIRTQLYFAGDFHWQGASFARAARAHLQSRWRARVTHGYNWLSTGALFRRVRLTATPTAVSNRFYLVLEK